MVFVPDKATRKAKYDAAIGQVPGSYKAGVQRVTDWKEKAISGQGLYETQMQNSNVLKRREVALQKVSNDSWRQAAAEKGSVRIADGMRAGSQKQADNYEPIAQALRGVNLPDRTADPMANIDNRVKPVVKAAMEASGKY